MPYEQSTKSPRFDGQSVEKIEPIIEDRLGNWSGSNAGDNRVFVNASFWIVRKGAPWRNMPTQYGKYNRRFHELK